MNRVHDETPDPPQPDFNERGPGILLGYLALTLGAFLALFGFAYGPIASGSDAGGAVSVTSQQAMLGVVGGIVATMLALLASFLFRGSIAMTALSVVVAVVAVINVVQLVPYL